MAIFSEYPMTDNDTTQQLRNLVNHLNSYLAIPDFTDLTLNSPWTDFDTDNFHKLGYRVVGKTFYFRGVVSYGDYGTFISQIPTKYAPSKNLFLDVIANNGSKRIYILTDGNIMYDISGTVVADHISFDGLSFQLD